MIWLSCASVGTFFWSVWYSISWLIFVASSWVNIGVTGIVEFPVISSETWLINSCTLGKVLPVERTLVWVMFSSLVSKFPSTLMSSILLMSFSCIVNTFDCSSLVTGVSALLGVLALTRSAAPVFLICVFLFSFESSKVVFWCCCVWIVISSVSTSRTELSSFASIFKKFQLISFKRYPHSAFCESLNWAGPWTSIWVFSLMSKIILAFSFNVIRSPSKSFEFLNCFPSFSII